MTQYTQTVSKRTGGLDNEAYQTGLLPALPALPAIGSAATSAAGYAGAGLGIGALASKAKNFLSLGKFSKAASGSSKAGNAAVGAGKVAGTGILLNEFNNFMNAGPTVGGVKILPLLAVGGAGLLGANMMIGGDMPIGLILPLAGAGILAGGFALKD